MRLCTLAAAILAWWSTGQTMAQDVTDLCSRGTMTAAVGPITAETFSYGGVDRHYCVYTSSLIGAGTQHPLVIALHGGNGNASQMMGDARRIIEHAEAMGWIAVFPNGLPRPSCGGASPCLNNAWGAPENVFFIAELISRMQAGGQVQDDRVHLIGFSGGAKLIYDIAATPGFPHAIRSVATVAGAFGLFHADRPEEGFSVTQIDQGTPVSALLAQGGLDTKLPVAGGLDETGRESHVSFRSKVDYWRLVTGTGTATPQPVDVPALAPSAPTDVTAWRYSPAGGLTVVEVLDPTLPHAWPSWDIMAVMVEFFEQS
jgi:poly(3-hydroxybutyrate) depolymerase